MRNWVSPRIVDQLTNSTRLLCFPYAGGSSVIFRHWKASLLGIDVVPIELPGHGTRFGEPLITSVAEIVQAMYNGLGHILEKPFCLFGHSMGGLLAYELVHAIRESGGLMPQHLFISGTPAPNVKQKNRNVRGFSRTELLQLVNSLGGTPSEFFQSEELQDVMLPIFQADLALLESYAYEKRTPLELPITTVCGNRDTEVTVTVMNPWRQETSGEFSSHIVSGDHFYLDNDPAELFAIIRSAIGRFT